MKHLEDMTVEEIKAWEAAKIAESRRQFDGQPLPEVSRVKAADYPHLERTGWGFDLAPGAPIRVEAGDATAMAVVVGLCQVSDGGPLALLIRVQDGSIWALRREGDVVQWAQRVTTLRTATSTRRVAVAAWQVSDDEVADKLVGVHRPTQTWRVESTHLEREP